MHLDAGDLDQAEMESRRAIALDPGTDVIAPQATRTLAHARLVRGDFASASELARSLLTHPPGGRAVVDVVGSAADGPDRTGAGTPARGRHRRPARPGRSPRPGRGPARAAAAIESCSEHPTRRPAGTGRRRRVPALGDAAPPVLVAQARELLEGGDLARAAGRAADAVVLADSALLGRDALDARLVLGFALTLQGEPEEARATLLEALSNAATIPSPLRAADALDVLAHVAVDAFPRPARALAATAAALRAPRAARRVGARLLRRVEPSGTVPAPWVRDDQLTPIAVAEIAALLAPTDGQSRAGPLGLLTPAERTVADKVAEGLTSRQIAADLFLSPRTVDTHLSRIYRKLDINTRARLATLVTGHG